MKRVNTGFVVFILFTYLARQTETQAVNPTIKEYRSENNGDGEYNFRFVLSDGTEREESGKFESEGEYVVRGYYSYLDDRSQKHYVEYYADKSGYHPTLRGDKKVETEGTLEAAVLPADVIASLIG